MVQLVIAKVKNKRERAVELSNYQIGTMTIHAVARRIKDMSGGFESFYSISSNIYLSLTTQIFNEQFCNHERTTVIDNFSPLPMMES